MTVHELKKLLDKVPDDSAQITANGQGILRAECQLVIGVMATTKGKDLTHGAVNLICDVIPTGGYSGR